MKAVNLASLLLGLVVLVGEFSFIYNQCAVVFNVAYGGTDISSTTSATNTVGSCCTDCCANPACQSWTYDSTTKKCTLKSTPPSKCSLRSGFMGASGNKPITCASSAGQSTSGVSTSTAAAVTTTTAGASTTTVSTTVGPKFCYNEADTTYTYAPVSAVVLGTTTAPASPGECCSQCAKVYPTCKSWSYFASAKICTLFSQIALSSGDRKADPGNTSGTVIVA